jgi:hypothetical protein
VSNVNGIGNTTAYRHDMLAGMYSIRHDMLAGMYSMYRVETHVLRLTAP